MRLTRRRWLADIKESTFVEGRSTTWKALACIDAQGEIILTLVLVDNFHVLNAICCCNSSWWTNSKMPGARPGMTKKAS